MLRRLPYAVDAAICCFMPLRFDTDIFAAAAADGHTCLRFHAATQRCRHVAETAPPIAIRRFSMLPPLSRFTYVILFFAMRLLLLLLLLTRHAMFTPGDSATLICSYC